MSNNFKKKMASNWMRLPKAKMSQPSRSESPEGVIVMFYLNGERINLCDKKSSPSPGNVRKYGDFVSALDAVNIEQITKCVQQGANINCDMLRGSCELTPLACVCRDSESRLRGRDRKTDPYVMEDVRVKAIDAMISLGADYTSCLGVVAQEHYTFKLVKHLVEKYGAHRFEEPETLIRSAIVSKDLRILRILLKNGVTANGAAVIQSGDTFLPSTETSIARTNPKVLFQIGQMTSSSGIPRPLEEVQRTAREHAIYFLSVITMVLLTDVKSKLKYITEFETGEIKRERESLDLLCPLDLMSLASATKKILVNMDSMLVQKKKPSGNNDNITQFRYSVMDPFSSFGLENSANKNENTHLEFLKVNLELLRENGITAPDRDIPSLKEFCRWTFRAQFGTEVRDKLDRLTLRQNLKDYLGYPEMDGEPVYKELFNGCYYGCLFSCFHGVDKRSDK